MLWEENYLAHYGIQGMRWGVRRFQNKDGTLTEAGKRRYGASAEEVKEKLDAARLKEHEAKAKYERKQNRRIQINPFEPVHSGKKYAKAMKKANKIEEIYQKLPKDQKVSELVIGGKGEKKSLFQKISDHFEAQFYPPEMRGKSKEEKKAWEERERKKFDAYAQKEQAELNFHKKIDKFDKLSDEEKARIGSELLERVSKYDKDWENATHDQRKEADGMRDWLFQQIDKKSGNWNTGDSVSENHRKAMSEMHEVSNKIQDYEKEVKKKIGYKDIPYDKVLDSYTSLRMIRDAQRKDEFNRFKAALAKESGYMDLVKEWDGKADKLMSAVLKDIGFADTPQNRSTIYPYVIYT